MLKTVDAGRIRDPEVDVIRWLRPRDQLAARRFPVERVAGAPGRILGMPAHGPGRQLGQEFVQGQ
jgi:hypothetical protein